MPTFDDALRGVGVTPPKNHFDDLIQAAYTGPQSGNRIAFRYREMLPKNIKRRLGANRYIGIDGVEYQDLGNDDWRYNVECFFTGPTHPADAAALERLLLEPAPVGSPGLLEHPREKVREVVVASVRVIHDPNKDANQTKVQIEFRDQLTLPADQRDRPELAVQRALESFSSAAANEFAVVSTLNTIADRVATAREVVAQLNIITETMGEVLDATSQIQADFIAIRTDITNNLDTLLDAPDVLAANLVRLVHLALSAPADIFSRADAYSNLYRRSVGIDDDSVPTLFGLAPESVTRNLANLQGLVASAASAGMLVNVVQGAGAFLTKQAAYEAASGALASVTAVTRALETTQDTFDLSSVQRKYVTPQTLSELRILKRLCYAATQQITSRLLATRIITLQHDTPVFQVCYEYYEDISDDTLWALIDANNLSLEEMVVIPGGRELYV